MQAADEGHSYETATSRFEALRALEGALPLHRHCLSTLLTHGRKVPIAAVYFHGFTSCPAQGRTLAERLYDLGHNVFLPRMFGHGGSDPKTASMAGFSSDKLVEMANQSVDLAAGLGNRVIVLGLSAGGTIASWIAQNRADVSQVIAISPFFGPYMLPSRATELAVKITMALPDIVIGWNPLANVPAKEVDYPFSRPATHALAQIMALGQEVQADARARAPAAEKIDVLLNEADRSVSNDLTHGVIDTWRRHGKDVTIGVLPMAHRLPHDLINPFEKGNDFEVVYAALRKMLPATN